MSALMTASCDLAQFCSGEHSPLFACREATPGRHLPRSQQGRMAELTAAYAASVASLGETIAAAIQRYVEVMCAQSAESKTTPGSEPLASKSVQAHNPTKLGAKLIVSLLDTIKSSLSAGSDTSKLPRLQAAWALPPIPAVKSPRLGGSTRRNFSPRV
jgi:hypothetical protein